MMASSAYTELTDEFAIVAETAAEAGLGGRALPRVRRDWGSVPAGGHVSGVFWGEGPPELVLLHHVGESARAWDAVALAAGRPSVAIDLPGHGRSDWRRDGRYEPGMVAPAVAGAIRSFAPRAGLVAGVGLGGLTALALGRRAPELLPRLALVNTLPGSPLSRTRARAGAERFASREAALTVLAARRPESAGRRCAGRSATSSSGTRAGRGYGGTIPATCRCRREAGPARTGRACGRCSRRSPSLRPWSAATGPAG